MEHIEGGQKLVVLQLDRLPPPERLASGLKQFVVWLQPEGAPPRRAGVLRYDREHRSGNLMATTPLERFTVRVTGEREARPTSPSGVLVAERRVVIN